jgi:hypothetical protein
MSPAPKITDTQSLYATVGEIHGKVESLVAGQEALFTLARKNEQEIAVHKEYCAGVQEAKAVKEVADEKAKSRSKAIVDSLLIFVLVTAIGLVGGACYQLWQAHIKATTEIVNPK